MTSKAQKEAQMLAAALAYQRDTEKIAKSISKATKRAVKELAGDADAIFGTFMRKGGFTSRAEAQACLDAPIVWTVRQRLIALARTIYEGAELERILIRLSSPSYKHRIDNAKALRWSAKMRGDALYKEVIGQVVDGMDRVADEASGRASYDVSHQAKSAIDWTLPNEGQLKAVHREVGVYHKVKLFTADELEDARTRITAGILDGEGFETISRKVMADTGTAPYKARRLVRTTMNQAAADATARKLREAGLKEYEIVCVLDEKTCPLCGQYDGKVYSLDDPDAPRPTFHPNCRCIMGAVLPDSIKDTSIRAARDEKGKSIRVPRTMTYKEWREQYGPTIPEPDHKKA